MKRKYVIQSSHQKVRGFGYLIHSAFSLLLLIVNLALPLAPVFASEEVVVDENHVEQALTPSVETVEDIEKADESSEDSEIQKDEEITEVVSLDDDGSAQIESDGSEAVLDEDDEDVQNSESVEQPTVPSIIDTSDAVVEEETTTPENDLTDGTIVDTELLDDITPETTETIENILIPTGDEFSIEDNSTTTKEEIVIEDTEVIPLDETDTETPPEDIDADLNEEDSVTDDDSSEVENAPQEVPQPTLSPEETLASHALETDRNKFVFSKDECTTVGDGTFYCAEPAETPTITENDRVFSALDEDGDKEIYIEKSGELIAITQNTVDDDAPYFDESSNTIVWHRLIDGRYQIISYDVEDAEETQITNDRYNNMQPNRFGDALVWQGWVGNDWEILLLEDDELTMLTDNTVHDITPSVNGTHIVWQSFENNKWQMKVYDIRTKITETIEDSEGGSIQNPRFVLVYDTKFETGDVQTRGYDLQSGEVIELSSTPAPIPKEIPDPEQTGEDRALVTQQTQTRTKVEGNEDDDIDFGTSTPDTLDDGDIVIPSLDLVEETIGTTTQAVEQIEDVVVLPIEDVVTTEETAHIDDVVVTPYIPSPQIDSQEAIATE